MNRPDTNAEVEWMMQENQQVTIDEVDGDIRICHGLVNCIIHEVLQYKKAFGRWVPNSPSVWNNIMYAKLFLQCFEAEGDGFLQYIATEHEC